MAEKGEQEVDAGPTISVETEAYESLLARHRKETKELQSKIQSLKKSVPKGDKKKRKEVNQEIARLEQALQEKLEGELAAIELKGQDEVKLLEESDDEGHVLDQIPTPGGGGGAGRRSRAQKRREKKAQRERDAQGRITEGEALDAVNNPRLIEREKLEAIISPLGLVMKDIQPDGHCLYAALGDQLSVRLGVKATVDTLRHKCSDYIRSHSTDYLPFLSDPSTGEPLTHEQFQEYCDAVESTAAWGGQLEVRALSHVYGTPVKIYQTEGPVLTIGEEYSNKDVNLHISYHRHEYGLGEHYNSLVPKDSKSI